MNRTYCLLAALALSLHVSDTLAANLLNNPGFEDSGDQDTSAKYWKMNDPNDHGDAWGNAIRVDWRSHEGKYIGAIRGTWAGIGEYGGFWQEAEAAAGSTYRAGAWFWADGGWKAEVQELKLEFWNSDRSMLLGSEVVNLHDVGELWVQKEVEAVAPEGTGWARVVVNVSGAGPDGALQVDELLLESTW